MYFNPGWTLACYLGHNQVIFNVSVDVVWKPVFPHPVIQVRVRINFCEAELDELVSEFTGNKKCSYWKLIKSRRKKKDKIRTGLKTESCYNKDGPKGLSFSNALFLFCFLIEINDKCICKVTEVCMLAFSAVFCHDQDLFLSASEPQQHRVNIILLSSTTPSYLRLSDFINRPPDSAPDFHWATFHFPSYRNTVFSQSPHMVHISVFFRLTVYLNQGFSSPVSGPCIGTDNPINQLRASC